MEWNEGWDVVVVERFVCLCVYVLLFYIECFQLKGVWGLKPNPRFCEVTQNPNPATTTTKTESPCSVRTGPCDQINRWDRSGIDFCT